MKNKNSGNYFRFKKNDSIGSADAEFDEKFLSSCFINTGDYDVLRDFEDAKRIIVGRTGSGKSALIKTLSKNNKNIIELRPEDLSLNYLSNSKILRFFEEAGTALDVFYQLLWKHVLVVELIRAKYNITNEIAQESFFQIAAEWFNRDRTKKEAIRYLQQWGNNFWNETENRVKEITRKIEDELKASISGTVFESKLDASASTKLNTEEKREIINHGSQAVNKVQLASLAKVISLLQSEVFNDARQGFYVVIDDLDTKWVDDTLKYKLIRALIETIKTFRQVKQVKIICAIRLDLLQRVISATKDTGFQSEKYESLYLRLRWDQRQLINVIENRLAKLVHERYTAQGMSMDDIFPREIQRTKFQDFLCERTSLRPREAILFINECLSRATDRHQITAQIVIDAEASYSEKRVTSLEEEWSSTYPKINEYLKILIKKPMSFSVNDFQKKSLEDWAYQLLETEDISNDPVFIGAKKCYLDDTLSFHDFLVTLIESLYSVGVIGLKTDATKEVLWSYYSEHKPAVGSISRNTILHIHPTFWRALGIASTSHKKI